MAFVRVVEVKYSKTFRLTYFIRSFARKLGGVFSVRISLIYLTLISESLMAENKKVSSVSFFNSRLTSVISISLVLFLLGLILLIGMLGNKLSVYVKENLSFSIVLKDNQKETEIKKMQKSLDALPFIKSTEYISKEQAAKELEEELGENPETFLGFNPLQASIEVKLHSEYANPDSLQVIEKKIRNYTSVSELPYRKDMMEMVHNNMKRLGLILLTLAAVLMIISFVLISNTIRLLIYSKRFLIHTMKLVGATSGFIRRPFVKYNIVSGISLYLGNIDANRSVILFANELKGLSRYWICKHYYWFMWQCLL